MADTVVHTPETVTAQMQADISAANAVTGRTDTTVHDAVTALIAGFGSGGGSSSAVKTASGSYTLAEDSANMIIDISALDFIPDVVFVSLDETGITYTSTPTKRWALIYAPALLEYIRVNPSLAFSRTNFAVCWRGNQGTETQQTGTTSVNYVGYKTPGQTVGINVSRSAGTYPIIAGTYKWNAYKIYED